MKSMFLKKVSMILSLFFCFGFLPKPVLAEQVIVNTIDTAVSTGLDKLEADDVYYADRVSELTSIICKDQDTLVFNLPHINVLSPDNVSSVVSAADSFDYSQDVLRITPNSTLEFEIDIPSAGGYHIALDYYVPGSELQELEIDLKINGEYQYIDSKNIKLPVSWKDSTEDHKIDQYGNQIYPQSQRVYKWYTHALNSSMYQFKTPYIFELKEGKNRISISSNEVEYLLGSIRFLGEQKHQSYTSYRQLLSGKKIAESDNIVIEGESYSEKSHAHIRGERTKNYNFYPYSPKETLINNLSPLMWRDPGEWVTYKFDVKTPGVYYISFKYQQSVKDEMPVYKNIFIDGDVLFDEMLDYSFTYTSTKPQNHVLSVDDENVGFYFEKGIHTITLQSTASVYSEIYESLLGIVREMNNISLEIKMITGNKVDKDRDWNIEEYIPELKHRLFILIDDLDNNYKKLSLLAGKENVPAIANLAVASKSIRQFTIDKGNKKGLDKLVNNLDHFSQGSGSITEYISTVLTILLEQPMTLDQIFVTPDPESLPKANVNFIKAFYEEVKKLLISYTTNFDSNISTDEDKLNIWVNRPVTHIEALRELISTEYNDRGIEVNLSAMPDENRLVLSIAAGDAPDGVLGLSINKPFDLALRGAVHNLRSFDDFGSTMKDFTPEMFVPFVLDDGVYAIPETANFYVQFYRTDIMNKLGIEVPRTWEELIKILPVLDRYGMNVNTIIAGADALKNLNTSVPFIQQYEGELYSSDGTKVAFDNPKTLESFQLMTDLYTRYNMPTRIVNFYNNFKSGSTPLGVQNLTTYILLKNAAPEIFGQWKIAPNIGVINDRGELVDTTPIVESGSVIMKQSEKKQQTWDFIKWWLSDETQFKYSTDLQLRFGKEYVWNTANLEALSQYTYFSSEEKEIILDMMRGAKEVPRHPAYFQVERELSNAWNSVVFNGVSVREALDKSALSANRVIAKKLKEFGYMSDTGEIIKQFKVPLAEEIAIWGEE